MRFAGLILAVISFFSVRAFASIGLVVGEPFGGFGTMAPVGHAGIYLDHICAESPTQLRPCRPGELGVVIARYHDIKATQLDWLAYPVSTYLYGVSNPSQAPSFITHELEVSIRNDYWRAHLQLEAPGRIDSAGNLLPPKYGDWEEGIGAAFDRRLLIYTIDTTPEQDAAIIALLNSDSDHRRYKIARNNCADFAAQILSSVLPREHPSILSRNIAADWGIATPKNLARRLDTFALAHPELHPRVYEIPQLPGTLRRSRPLRGCAETFVKTKRYIFTFGIIQPELELADWILYEAKGRWTPGLDALTLSPSEWNSEVTAYAPPSSRSTSSRTASEGIGFFAK